IYVPGEVWPAIPFSRCLGNLVAKQLGVISKCEVNDRSLEEVNEEFSTKLKFIILATDGVWRVMKDQQAVAIVHAVDKDNVQYAVSSIVLTAQSLWE
ncbi:unnamed protein product, partial [Polarella glacialis]